MIIYIISIKTNSCIVRKKLKWGHEPFDIPNDLLKERKKIGENASQKANKHELKYKKTFSNINKLDSFKNLIEKTKNEYLKNLRPLATRKSSEMFLNIIAKLPNLIGGSADLAGSNNTKTINHKIIKPGDFSETIFTTGLESMQCVE